ncbi:MAG TPA: methyltransferase domain-containing protein [Waterburya sp.]|jgi:trans-aconitate methyltransferase
MNNQTLNPSIEWDAELYDSKHAFVSQLGASLIQLLSPQKGERILDLGCGTGHLTQQIAATEATVLGIDSAETMIEQARKNYPTLQFVVEDATNLPFQEEFDAVFSNAVLHWIKQPELVVSSIWRSLKPGGRFVAEFGGKGNVQAITTAIHNVLHSADYATAAFNPWYFPSIGEYSAILEKQGFELTFATLFARPTPLEGEQGMQNWLQMFAKSLFSIVPTEEQSRFMAQIEAELRPQLYQDGKWLVNYKRIQVRAIKP